MATSFGVTGASIATAAAPTLHVKPDSVWTVEVKGGGCERAIFWSGGTFHADLGGDGGLWRGGGKTISMAWTAGNDEGQTFTGHFVSTTKPVEYKGPMTETVEGRGKLVMGSVGSC